MVTKIIILMYELPIKGKAVT